MPPLGTSALRLVLAHGLDKAALPDVIQAGRSQQQLLRQGAGSEFCVRRHHILERCNISRHVVVRSCEVWDHLEPQASRNAASSNFARQTPEHSSFLDSEKEAKRAKHKVMC